MECLFKIGDIVWFAEPDNWVTLNPTKQEVIGVGVNYKGEPVYETYCFTFWNKDLGTRVFRTREEAEKELERKGYRA